MTRLAAFLLRLSLASLAVALLAALEGRWEPKEAPAVVLYGPDCEAQDEGLDSLQVERLYFGGGR